MSDRDNSESSEALLTQAKNINSSEASVKTNPLKSLLGKIATEK